MKINNLLFLSLLAFGCSPKLTNELTNEKKPMYQYPETFRDPSVVEDYHGTSVADPYRWLEDDNSAETKAWVNAQNAVTFDYLSKIPNRDSIRQRLEQLWNYERFGIPFKEGGQYYFFKNDGLQNQSVLYSINTIEDTQGEIVLDPNTFSEDGTSSLGGMSFDKEGKYLAYQVSKGGSDWMTINILDIASKTLLKDELNWIKFSGISWFKDGFFYSRYPSPEGQSELSAKNEFHSVYYHKLGTDQSADKLVYMDSEHPQRNVYAQTSDDQKFLLLSVSESTSGSAIFVKSLETETKLSQIVEGFDYDYQFIGNEGSILYFITNRDAAKQQIVAINYDQIKAGKAIYETIVPQSDDALRSASMVGGKLFLSYLHNASSRILVYDLAGNQLGDVTLPGIGTASSVNGKKTDKLAFISYTSFTTPSCIYTLDTETYALTLFRKPSVDFDPEMYETKQVWYKSKDGTRVPMFLTYKKGIALDGTAPTLLYGYGGFDIPILPGFSLTKLPLLEAGGIYAVANIRGGGEFGSEWHKSGTKERKQNVFDDFIAAAEYLIAENYTSSSKLAIEGRSNGGLLVGACMTQRPDLFKVAFPGVGVLDMLRYHKFTIGWAWAADYGRSDEAEAFDYLYKYSPLHNVKEQAYPATMVVTADHDDRVVPAHSFKFISELQHQQRGANPVLIRIDVSAGHGAGMPTSKQIDQATDILAFMLHNIEK